VDVLRSGSKAVAAALRMASDVSKPRIVKFSHKRSLLPRSNEILAHFHRSHAVANIMCVCVCVCVCVWIMASLHYHAPQGIVVQRSILVVLCFFVTPCHVSSPWAKQKYSLYLAYTTS